MTPISAARPGPATRQALLLFIQEYRKEHKKFGFGNQLDESVHQALLRRTLALLRDNRRADLVIVHGGRVPHLDQAHYLAERGDDFNSRFGNALRDTFSLGYERVVAVGGDIPALSSRDIDTALSRDELVVGPTHDGGFYLAAVSKHDLPLLDQLPWRQPQLCQELLQRARLSRRSCFLLPRRHDIDHIAAARQHSSLLLRLVSLWLTRQCQRPLYPRSREPFLVRRLPDPRYTTLPPPAVPQQ